MAERLVIDDITHWARTYKVSMLCSSPTAPSAYICYLTGNWSKVLLSGYTIWHDSACPKVERGPLRSLRVASNKARCLNISKTQVDGFRFDIMGHLMVPSMQKIQSALGALTMEQDGVDGKGIYIYGEAWDFGEVLSLLSLMRLMQLSNACSAHQCEIEKGRRCVIVT